MNTEQDELLAEMSDDISDGRISISPDLPSVELIKRRYPLGLNRIAWNKVPGALCSPAPKPMPKLEAYLPTIKEFIDGFAVAAGITSEDNLTVVGDLLTDVAIRMSLPSLKTYLRSILEIPQGIYVLTNDGEWCFNFTMEDDMYFGRATLT